MARSERPTGQHPRYRAENSKIFDGRWAVIDTFTGWAAVVRGIPLSAFQRTRSTAWSLS
ncbi:MULTISPECIES: hypothetical protein [unclassified Rhizobium]|uniref:hypothetical protein n=1 Tax=unclassified Rhizobium TaxID=2613769 RepID=UPI00140497F6|nr:MULTISPECIES: hypothetical protein [unclassified Rhizobium]MBB3397361.1 transposase [Rhizobium sp. BK060]